MDSKEKKYSKQNFAKSLKSNGVKVTFPNMKLISTPDRSFDSALQENSAENGFANHVPLHKKMSSTSFGNNLTPTYWSASQLLSQHELRKRDQQDESRNAPNLTYDQGHPIGADNAYVSEYGQQRHSYANYGHGNDVYNGHYGQGSHEPNPYHQRHSTSSECLYGDTGRGVYADLNLTYHPEPGSVYKGHPNRSSNRSTSTSHKNISDISSSTLGIINQSINSSQLSINSEGRDPDIRNITQV